MTSYPGADTLGVVTKAPTGRVDAMNQPITTESVVWVYGCVFEPGTHISAIGVVTEKQTDTITSAEQAWAFLPYVAGVGVPGVDDNGDQVAATITNSCWIRPRRADPQAQRDYKVLGLPQIHYDIDGLPDHVLVNCEWRAG